MNQKAASIVGIPEISAIYFALLQCGYDYYSMERSPAHLRAIENFLGAPGDYSFFAGARQNACEEFVVRLLTESILSGNYPPSLSDFIVGAVEKK